MKDTRFVAAAEFIRHPAMVGSAFPATARMVRHMLAPLDWTTIDVVVEYGPGSGRFTFEMLRRMRPNARLVAIETGKAFVEQLRAQCDDPRLEIVHDSAQGVRAHLERLSIAGADCILTGLPFSTLDAGQADAIMRETASALASGGLLAAYQMRTAIRPLIDRYFTRVRHGYEWWNLPPCHLFWANDPRIRS